MTDQYAVLRARPLTAEVEPEAVGFQWRHSILNSPDYVSPWQAVENAVDLAFELNPSCFIASDSTVHYAALWPKPPSSRRRQVCFDDQVELLCGYEGSQHWFGGLHRIEYFQWSRFWHIEAFCHLNPELPDEDFHDEVHGLHTRPLFDFCSFPRHPAEEPDGPIAQGAPRLTLVSADALTNPITLGGIREVKPTSRSIDAPPAEAPEGHPPQADGVAWPERQAPGQTEPAWIRELWTILQSQGQVEMLEEGAVAYFNSHFISHERHRRNPAPRPVRIDLDYETWEAGFRFIWEDLQDPAADLDVVLVRPMPPVTIFQGTVGTLVLIQHPLPDHSACVLTSVLSTLPEPRITETAHSTESRVPYDDIVQLSDMADLCRGLSLSTFDLCDLRIGSRELPPGQEVQIYDGLGLQLTFLRDEDDISIEVIDDEHALMQSSSTSSSRTASSSEAPDRFFSRIFRFDNSYVDGILSWESSNHFWQVVGDLTHLSRKQIRKIYQVRDPPNDLNPRFKKVFILASLQGSCPSEHMRVTLVDVQYADVATRNVRFSGFLSKQREHPS